MAQPLVTMYNKQYIGLMWENNVLVLSWLRLGLFPPNETWPACPRRRSPACSAEGLTTAVAILETPTQHEILWRDTV